MAYPHDDNDIDEVIYAVPQRNVDHPGRQQRPGSSIAWKRDTGRTRHDQNPVIYRCDLENTIDVDIKTGVDATGNDIIVTNLTDIKMYNMRGQFARYITCNELKSSWDVKICDSLVYISDNNKSKKSVLILDDNGNVKDRKGLPSKEVGIEGGPLGLAIDNKTKDIYVSSFKSSIVYRCTHDSAHFKPFITSGLSAPAYLCVGPGHDVIVSNYESDTICKYSNGGDLKWRYGGKGSGNGQLYAPLGICTDPYGNIYVADYGNNRVVHISQDGQFLSNVNFGEAFEDPQALAFRNNRLIITTGLEDDRGQENKIFIVKCQFCKNIDLKAQTASICRIL